MKWNYSPFSLVKSALVNSTNPLNLTISCGQTPLTPYVKNNSTCHPHLIQPKKFSRISLVELTGADCMYKVVWYILPSCGMILSVSNLLVSAGLLCDLPAGLAVSQNLCRHFYVMKKTSQMFRHMDSLISRIFCFFNKWEKGNILCHLHN